MKKINSILLLFLVFSLLNSCGDKVKETFYGNVPIYMSYEELREPTVLKGSQQLENPGKIYIYDDYLFVVEWYEGVHIFDNSSPSNPMNLGFMAIPGCVDIAVQGNTLYASSFTDLVVVDVSDPASPSQITRENDMFAYTYTPVGNFDSSLPVGEVDETQGVVINWKQEETTVTCTDDCHSNFVQNWMPASGGRNITFTDAATSTTSTTSSGQGGSLARFAIAQNHLYVVSMTDLHVVDISSPSSPSLINDIELGNDIETIFPHEDKLFIGSETSVHIYDISSPTAPHQISVFTHVRACDPVVVQGDLAYATLRAGGPCGGGDSQLLVIDISDIYNPLLKSSYTMTEPYGLGIDDDALFICEGDYGLRVFNAENPMQITSNELEHFEEIHAYDVIPFNKVLILTGDHGIYQYDYTDPEDLQLLSVIGIN